MNNYTNISNYLGEYSSLSDYEKFDFVFHPDHGIYFYAKNDIPGGENNVDPSLDTANWSSDSFFFDADYGSSVKFSCTNNKKEYGDGYYTCQPKGINSLRAVFDLQFKNRSNKEANAIIHFVESHLGQYDKDRPSPNLKYNQGIEGFRWSGGSAFYPYISVDNTSKKFYCLEYNHSLNFENSNDISLKLINYDTSLLNKSECLYVSGGEAYNANVYYEKNDIVLFEGNHKYYYCTADEPIISVAPASERSDWSRDGGYFKDENKERWSRKFLWKPSIGMKIDQRPRMKYANAGNDYVQVYRDGDNEKLLSLNLSFNNRSDEEARAILHFLEHHHGSIPFEFAPPAPYEKARNFICQNWEHVYNYKGNHSIQAKFEEFPFALSAERYDAIITEPILRESEFIISSLITLEDSSENLNFGNKFRKRVFFENVGDKSLTVSSIRILSGPFSIIGKQVEYDAPMLIENQAYDYKFNLDVDSSLPFNLSGQSIKMFRQYSDGAAGGVTFAAVDSFGSRLTSEGNYSSFLQNNTGTIINLVTGEKSKSYNNFINQNFIKNNASSILLPGQRGYIDIAYDGNLSIEDFSSPVEGINEILNTYLLSKVFTGQLTIGVYHSNGDLEWVNSDIQIQLYR